MARKATYNMSIYQKKYKSQGTVKEFEEVDITSLLDILVILLVFLLKSYSASSLDVNLVKDLDLTSSTSVELGQFGATVQINKDEEIFIDNEKISTLTSPDLEKVLSERLLAVKSKIKAEANKHINIVVDSSLKYEKVDKVMSIAAQNEYEDFKFIVRGSNN